MSHRRPSPSSLWVAAIASLPLLLPASRAGAEGGGGDAPCTIATKGDSPVASACAKGGRKAAMATMKDVVRKANANGGDFKCGNCHKNTKSFELKDNAPDDFKKLVAAASGKK